MNSRYLPRSRPGSPGPRSDIRQGLFTLRNKDLQAILVRLGLAKSGRKDALVKKIARHLRFQPQDTSLVLSLMVDYGCNIRGHPPAIGWDSLDHLNQTFSMPTLPTTRINNFDITINNLHSFPQVSEPAPFTQEEQELAKLSLTTITSSDPFFLVEDILESLIGFSFPSTRAVFNTPSSLWQQLKTDQFKLLLYSTDISSGGTQGTRTHEWPSKISIKLNDLSLPVIKKHYDQTKKKSKAVLERPCDLSTQVKTGMNYLTLSAQPESTAMNRFAMRIVLSRVVSLDNLMRLCVQSSVEDSMALLEAEFDTGIIITELRVSVKDPLTLLPLKVPARGKDCKHIACFDLETFLYFQKTAKNAKWRCDICSKGPYTVKEIFVDKWMEGILHKLKVDFPSPEELEDVDEIMVSKDGKWKPVLEEAEEIPEERNENIEVVSLFSDDNSPQVKRPKLQLEPPLPLAEVDFVGVLESLSDSHHLDPFI